MKSRSLKVSGLALSVLGLTAATAAHPAHASMSPECKKVYTELAVTGGVISAIKIGLGRYVKSQEVAKDGYLATLRSEASAKMIDQTVREIEKAAAAAAEITAPVENLSTVFHNLAEVTKIAHKDAFDPLSDALKDIVKDLAVKAQYDSTVQRIKAAKKLSDVLTGVGVAISGSKLFISRECTVFFAQAPRTDELRRHAGQISPAVYRPGETGFPAIAPALYRPALQPSFTPVALTIKPGKKGQCRADMQKIIDDTVKLVETVRPGLDALEHAAGQASDILEKDVSPLYKPVEDVAKPIHDIYKATLSVHKAMKSFEHLLKHKIEVKVKGIVLVHESADDVLKSWHKIVDHVEKVLHIKDIKKLLEHEMDHLMKPVTDDIRHSIHTLERHVKIHGFSMNDARRELRVLEQALGGIKEIPGLERDFDTAKKRMDALAKECAA